MCCQCFERFPEQWHVYFITFCKNSWLKHHRSSGRRREAPEVNDANRGVMASSLQPSSVCLMMLWISFFLHIFAQCKQKWFPTHTKHHTQIRMHKHTGSRAFCVEIPQHSSTHQPLLWVSWSFWFIAVNWRQRAHVERTGEKSSVWECVVVHGGKCGLRNCLMFNETLAHTHSHTIYFYIAINSH